MGCSICLGSFTASSDNPPEALLCGHIFHAACIGQWIASQPPGEAHCPQCKQRAGTKPIRLFPSDPGDLDAQIRHLRPSASRRAEAVASALTLPSSSPERGDVLITRVSPRRMRAGLLPPLDEDDGAESDDDGGGGGGDIRAESPCAATRARQIAHQRADTLVAGTATPPTRMAAAQQQIRDAERERAALRGQWPQAAQDALLRDLVDFHLALQDWVTSAHGLKLYALPHAGRKVCAFIPQLAPRGARDTARLTDAIEKLQDAVEETERVRADLHKVLMMNEDGKKLYRQAEAAVAAERGVLAGERAKLREQRHELKRKEKAHQDWGKRLMEDANKADKRWEDMRTQMAEERQRVAAESEQARRQRREADLSVAQAQRDAEQKIQAALRAQLEAEAARDEAIREKDTTHGKNLRMAEALERLKRKAAQWESKLASKKDEIEALQTQVGRLERQPQSVPRSQPRSLPRFRPSPNEGGREKRPLSLTMPSDDSLDFGDDESLLIAPPRKKPLLSDSQDNGYDLLLSNLAGDVSGGEVRRSAQKMPASLFARPKQPSGSRDRTKSVQAPSTHSSTRSTEPPALRDKIRDGNAGSPRAGTLDSLLRLKQPNEDVSRLMQRAVKGNATGSKYKVPSSERRRF